RICRFLTCAGQNSCAIVSFFAAQTVRVFPDVRWASQASLPAHGKPQRATKRGKRGLEKHGIVQDSPVSEGGGLGQQGARSWRVCKQSEARWPSRKNPRLDKPTKLLHNLVSLLLTQRCDTRSAVAVVGKKAVPKF